MIKQIVSNLSESYLNILICLSYYKMYVSIFLNIYLFNYKL